ncbi:hypothetical protein [Rahnella laticis]|uniref:hypothetical protein n=1 Tax=Rahnella laticis TaxID=2787622 RepID=UPI0018A27F04|nr:hypothetical protein [Rahnella laticis]MBF7994084.1 hypothetical protein [Rahnella laticis]
MGSKDSSYDVVYRGDTREWIAPGTYVFFQRLKEHGGGYWLGQVFDDWFSFVSEEPISLRQGMHLLLEIKSQDKEDMKFDGSVDNFFLKG